MYWQVSKLTQKQRDHCRFSRKKKKQKICTFAGYQVPLKSVSTLESLQGNGSKVLECNQEPDPPPIY